MNQRAAILGSWSLLTLELGCIHLQTSLYKGHARSRARGHGTGDEVVQQGEVRALEECASHPVRRVSHPVVVGADQHLGENQGQHGRTALKRPKRLIGRGWPHLGAVPGTLWRW